MRTSAYIESKHKCFFILGQGPTQGLDNTRLTVKERNIFYFINYTTK